MTRWRERLVQKTVQPILRTTPAYRAWIGFLVIVVSWGVFAYAMQYRDGLVVTGMRDRISWGLYIAAFVFFTGISMAGTVISALLRMTRATWRAPVTRMAEVITAVALLIGALFIIVDMGRPDRVLNVYLFGRWQSPIMWDVMAITTYFMVSLIYLYAPMIPDLAIFRDRLAGRVGRLRERFYSAAALEWNGNEGQKRALGRAITVLMVVVLPIAVVVHSVVSWIFGMTLRVGWNTSIFSVLFVAGAVFSGVATLVIVMALMRRIFHWEEYITERQFRFLGYILGAFAAVMIYVNVAEYMTAGFKLEEGEEFAFRQLFVEDFSLLYWFYVVFGLVLPMLLMLYRRTRTVAGVVTAAILVNVAMFIERYFIVVSGLRVPLMPYSPADYLPTGVEWSVLAGGVALFCLIFTVAVKVVPMLAITEMTEEHVHVIVEELGERLPQTTGAPDHEPAGTYVRAGDRK